MIGELTIFSAVAWRVIAGTVATVPRPGWQGAAAPIDTLTAPPILKNLSSKPHIVEVVLTAAPARLALRPGILTNVFAYNGRVPGPTLEVHEGDSVIVHFTNQLTEPTTIHWHGIHLPAIMDGSPLYPIPAGGRFDYAFRVGAGTAGTYWYHPHPDARSGYQVAMGLFGALIVRAAADPLPASLPEKLLILSDNRFGPDGSVAFADPNTLAGQIDTENGREGDVLFVNGQIMPTVTIHSGEVQRWRIINTSGARLYRLAIPGQTLLHVGDDGGLFETPMDVAEVRVATSERVEILVRGTGAPGTRTTLETLPYDRYMPQTRPPDWNQPHDLLALQYAATPAVPPVVLPEVLRPIPALDTAQAVATQVVVMTQGLINGHVMDMGRVDLRARVGTTEIWELENIVGMDHPFHLHGFHFQVLDRNGVPVRYRSWKDSVNVPKHETVRIIVRFDDFAGKWMFHCHILDHEDQGMMGILQTY